MKEECIYFWYVHSFLVASSIYVLLNDEVVEFRGNRVFKVPVSIQYK